MEDWLEHYRRWDIEFDSEEAFEQFKYRLNNIVGTSGVVVNNLQWRRVCFFLGRSIAQPKEITTFSIVLLLREAKSFTEYVTLLQAIFRVYQEMDTARTSGRPSLVDKLYNLVEQCLSLSANNLFSIGKLENSVILYPKGAALLDSGIINQSLSWLSTHPVVLEHFSGALKRYMELADKDEESQRSLRDELRFSVEQLLKEILGNKKNLPNQAEPLEAWMKQKGSNPHVIGLYKNLLFGHYKIYQDDVKHSGTYDPQDLEFMIYLTGTFIRQLLQLEQKLNQANT